MATKRTPLRREVLTPLTPRAIELWEAMQRLECTCLPRDWDGAYWEHQECAGCAEAGRLDSELWRELQLKLWQWPAVEDPNAANPYPEGSHAWKQWGDGNLEAQARWKALQRASREARRARRPRASERRRSDGSSFIS